MGCDGDGRIAEGVGTDVAGKERSHGGATLRRGSQVRETRIEVGRAAEPLIAAAAGNRGRERRIQVNLNCVVAAAAIQAAYGKDIGVGRADGERLNDGRLSSGCRRARGRNIDRG